MGPLDRRDEAADALARRATSAIRSTGRTLGEYLEYLEQRGIAPNVASFVGATTVRVHELGEGDVDPTPAQLDPDAGPGPPGDERGRDGRRLRR